MLKVRDDVEICRCARLLFVGKSLLVALEEVLLVGRLQFLDTGAYSVSNYVFTCEVIIKKNSSACLRRAGGKEAAGAIALVAK